MEVLGAFNVLLPSAYAWKQEKQVIRIVEGETAPPEAFNGKLTVDFESYESVFYFANDGEKYYLDIDVSDFVRAVSIGGSGIITLSINTGETLNYNFINVGLIKPEFVPEYPKDTSRLNGIIDAGEGVNNPILPPQKQIDVKRIRIN